MSTPTRSAFAIAAMTILLAACTTAGEPSASPLPSDTPQPSVAAPSLPPASETPAASPEPAGTLTAADGAAPGGPGISLSDAMAGDLSQPVLVRGTLFKGADGAIYLADSLADPAVPTFGELRLRVENYPTDGPTWDIADAEITGLQEANGILFFEDTQLYGTIGQ